ncbi:DUF3810 domain-containing protein [Chryseobacterium sp. SNU WT5]|uniref:DUF3810 domain-containing protein n=1 Tax=Chryseobacterium sp. SNU WT5 TaxID=2594269 RepID=UPI0021D34470|nr:DUF3810 domain-containing protein [Chryseobacterium sp. SNU WT5]
MGDLLYIFIILLGIFSILKIIRTQNKNKYFTAILIGINILYFLYQCFWGMLYFQRPIKERLPNTEIKISKVKALTLEYLQRSKMSRKLVQEDQHGVFKIKNQRSIETEILNQQNHLPFHITSKKSTSVYSFKRSSFTTVINYTGILGYYNPFTAEAQYNSALPATYIPFTLAHESSHQLGFAREQEANFIGYLIGNNSENLDLKYSTEYFVLKSLLNYLQKDDVDFVKSVINQYSEGMKRDRNAEKMFIKKHEGILDIIFGYTNDLFLKSNQQEGSITYSYFIDLLLQYQPTSDHST